ncbi:MAG: hypothetical protein E3J35_06615 [Methanomassiliicoccales archaeon]|nr:MAG: hypothetical protein E3J35_06615 [Methanomassiliicoccales archaeon]
MGFLGKAEREKWKELEGGTEAKYQHRPRIIEMSQPLEEAEVACQTNLDEEDINILNLTETGPLTLEELCQELSISSDDCFARVRRLESLGLLKRVQECNRVDDNAVRVQNLYKAAKI